MRRAPPVSLGGVHVSALVNVARRIIRLGLAAMLCLVLTSIFLVAPNAGCSVCDDSSFWGGQMRCQAGVLDQCDGLGCQKPMPCESRCPPLSSAAECATVTGCKWNL